LVVLKNKKRLNNLLKGCRKKLYVSAVAMCRYLV